MLEALCRLVDMSSTPSGPKLKKILKDNNWISTFERLDDEGFSECDGGVEGDLPVRDESALRGGLAGWSPPSESLSFRRLRPCRGCTSEVGHVREAEDPSPGGETGVLPAPAARSPVTLPQHSHPEEVAAAHEAAQCQRDSARFSVPVRPGLLPLLWCCTSVVRVQTFCSRGGIDEWCGAVVAAVSPSRGRRPQQAALRRFAAAQTPSGTTTT